VAGKKSHDPRHASLSRRALERDPLEDESLERIVDPSGKGVPAGKIALLIKGGGRYHRRKISPGERRLMQEPGESGVTRRRADANACIKSAGSEFKQAGEFRRLIDARR
jgi:hypothetical protein